MGSKLWIASFDKLLLTSLFLLVFTVAGAQTITSVQDGPWNDTNTWSGGTIPDFSNSTGIVVGHAVSVPTGYAVTIDEANISALGIVTVSTGGTLTIAAVSDALVVDGILAASAGSSITGSSGTNIVFNSGATYRHMFTTTQGIIPLAAWDADATIEILGYTTLTTATAAGNWSQNFGNFTWNCTAQTATLNLNALVTSIAGSLNIASTGTGLLQLSTNQNPTVTIGGDVTIAGTSRVNLSTTGAAPGAIYNVAGNFTFNSTNATGSQTNTSGVCTVNITGNFSVNAPGGILRLATTPGGTGVGTLNIQGNFEVVAGTITESANNPGNGNINFVGSQEQTFTNLNNDGTNGILNMINYTIGASNIVRVVGESKLAGNAGSTLNLSGTIILESTNSTGALLNGNGVGLGNIRIATRNYTAGARIIYGGSSAQFLSANHPTTASVDCEIDNSAGVSLVSNATVTMGNDLIISDGSLNVTNANLTVFGDATLSGGDLNMTSVAAARTLRVDGNIGLEGGELQINSGTADAIFVINGTMSGSNFITFTGANNNIDINGTGALGIDFPLAGPSTIETLDLNRAGSTIRFTQNLTSTGAISLTAGNIDMDAALSITAGNLNLATGTTLFFEGQDLNLSRAFNSTLTGGVLSADAGSDLNIIGTGALGTLQFSPTGNTLGNFTMNRATAGNIVTLNSALTITTTMNLTDGQFTNTSGLNFSSGAVVTRNSAASLLGATPTGGPYNLILNGAAMTTAAEAAGSLDDMTSNSSAAVVLGTAVNAVGTITINSGSMACGTNAVSAADLTIVGTFTAPSTTLTLTGNISNNGTFNRNNGTVIFNGTSSLLGSSNPSFQNIIINGDFTGPATLNIYGSFTNNGTFMAGTTVAFLGTAGVTQVIGGTSVTDFNNITVSNTTAVPDVNVSTSQNLLGVLTLAANATFDADGSGGAVFTLVSSNDNPTQDASIATLPNGAQVQGNITVQRYMSGEGRIYRYISTPVAGATVASWKDDFAITGTFSDPTTTPTTICGTTLIPTQPSMYVYNETLASSGGADLGWLAYPTSGAAASNALTVGQGYAPFIRECAVPTVIDVTGTANQGNINVNLRYTNHAEPALDGYNLVGNPYPSAINWQAAGWSRPAAIGTVIAVRDNGAGTFTYLDYSDGSVNDLIASGQAFWVRTSTDNQLLGFREATKVNTSAVFYRTSGDNVLTISLQRGTITDKAFVKLNPSAKGNLDRYDGPRLSNAYFDLSTLSDESIPMAINAVSEITCGKEMMMNFKFAGNPNGNYAMELIPNGTFKGFQLKLVDKHTGVITDVTANPVYTFVVDNSVSSRAADRFRLLFEQQPAEVAATVTTSCVDAQASVTVKNAQVGVQYFATIEGIVSSDTLTGAGIDEALYVDGTKLKTGANAVIVHAVGQCFTQDINVQIVKNEQARITDVGIGQLQSSITTGNQWYLDGVLIPGATAQVIAASESGTYRVDATVNGCPTSAEFELIVMDAEQSRSKGIQVYPNPVVDNLTVSVVDRPVQEISLYNNMGVKLEGGKGSKVHDQYQGSFSMTKYPGGIYFVKVLGSGYISTIKIVKK